MAEDLIMFCAVVLREDLVMVPRMEGLVMVLKMEDYFAAIVVVVAAVCLY